MRLPHPTTALVTALTLVLAGCSALKPKADPTRFYVLRSASAPADANAGRSAAAAKGGLRIGPGRVADYLNSTPIAVQEGVHGVSYLDLHHWAEPLEKGVSRVLAENLGRSLNRPQTSVYPDPPPPGPGCEVGYEVLKFEGGLEEEVVLEVSWRVTERPSGRVLASTRSRYVVPADGTGRNPAAYVARLSEALDRWSRDVAAVIP